MIILIIFCACTLGLFLLQEHIIRKIWHKNLTAEISFDKMEIPAGSDSTLTEVITNRKWFPVPILHIKFQVHRNLRFHSMHNANISDQLYKNDVFSLLFYQRITRTLPFHCEHRGYYRITQADAVAYTLFYTGHMVQVLPQSTQLYVFPKPVPAAQLDIPFRRMMGALTTKRFLYQDPFAFQGIRDYTIQDPLKTVNWKASARTGELKTNTYEYTADQKVCILLNLKDETVWHQEQLLETSISLAASLSDRFLSAGIPITLYTNGLDIETKESVPVQNAGGAAQMKLIKRQLARIDLTQKTPEFSTVTESLYENIESLSGSCILVISYSCHGETAAYIRKLAAHIPGLFWIVPMYTDEKHMPASDQNMHVIRWEVTKNYVS